MSNLKGAGPVGTAMHTVFLPYEGAKSLAQRTNPLYTGGATPLHGKTLNYKQRLQLQRHRRTALAQIRRGREAENCKAEKSYGLYEDDRLIKKALITEQDAFMRNKNIASLGMAWRRVEWSS